MTELQEKAPSFGTAPPLEWWQVPFRSSCDILAQYIRDGVSHVDLAITHNPSESDDDSKVFIYGGNKTYNIRLSDT